jgi:hypothetical protein
MDPTPYFIMGALSGTAATLLIQAYARRKVAKATAHLIAGQVDQDQQIVTHELRERIMVLERIITDQPRTLADSIERLR